ncbi:histidine kinase [Maridesulfovibrio sp.]|uniref:histidine kinase n=1 Tax=Maridesulfovibrio sp. TaxID=2795000 RepID=UPI002A18CEE3|nr:histidine kinase [Maridesulfovibrio sp.]
MSEDDSLVEEFFSEVNDKYYPQVLEGIDLLDEQCIEEGIEILSRPLHTIKGVTGFMSGFEPASAFTHKVESFLKKMQSGEVDRKLPQIALAIESVNSIFMLIEQLRETGSYDKAATDDIESRLSGEGSPSSVAGPETGSPVEVESLEDSEIVTVKARRLFHQDQLQALREKMDSMDAGRPVLFDFSESVSVGSTFFELIAEYADSREIGLTGMNNQSMGIFYSWGFQKYLPVFESRESFLK